MITDIPAHELSLEDSPRLTRFRHRMSSSRKDRIMGVYELAQEIAAHPQQRDEILTLWSQHGAGGSKKALKEDLDWVERVLPDDLLAVFNSRGIEAPDIYERLTLTHFRTVARVQNKTSRERCELLWEAYHEHMFSPNFERWLIEKGHLSAPVPRGSVKRKSVKGKTYASDLLIRIAGHVREAGCDIELTGELTKHGNEPIGAGKFLRFLADKLGGVEFRA